MRFRNRFVLCIVPLAFALTGCFQQAGTALQEPIVTNQAASAPATSIPLPTEGDKGTDNTGNPGTLNTPTLGTVPDTSNTTTSTDNGGNPPVALTIISATIPPLATDTPSALVDAGGQTDQTTGQGSETQGTATESQFITPSGPLGPVTQVPVQAATTDAQPTSTPSGLITPTAFSSLDSSVDGCAHTVQSGDTLYRIAVKYGITVGQLQEANQQVQGTIIQPGDVLKIPGCKASGSTDTTVTQPTSTSSAPPTALPSGSQTYVVKRGDTLYTIGLKFGVTADAIQKANNISNPNRIDPGQELVIPPKSG